MTQKERIIQGTLSLGSPTSAAQQAIDLECHIVPHQHAVPFNFGVYWDCGNCGGPVDFSFFQLVQEIDSMVFQLKKIQKVPGRGGTGSTRNGKL